MSAGGPAPPSGSCSSGISSRPGQDKWTFGVAQLGNTEGRDNRISCYAFNLDARAGGIRLGIGSHFQDELTPGQWLLIAGAWDATRVSIYRDGVLRDNDLLDQSAPGGVTITPEHGDAPVRIGTRDFNSFLQGAISRVAIFNRKLADSEQAALHIRPHGRHPRQRGQRHPPGWSGSGGWARRREIADDGPILTMNRAATAVQTGVSAGRRRP